MGRLAYSGRMTDTARDRLTQAQAQMDTITADAATIAEFVGWLQESVARVDAFTGYYGEQWLSDRADAEAPDLPVTREDPGFDAITEHMRAVQRLARATFDAAVREYSD